MNDNEKYIEEFVNDIPFDAPNEKHRDELKNQLLNAFPKHRLQPTVHTVQVWRTIMKSRIPKLATAAVIAIIVLGGVTFWPSGDSENGQWWLGSPAAWGQEIMASLEKVEAVICRQRALIVRDYGPDTIGTLWEKRYAARDMYRKDILDDANNVISTEWILPNGEGFVKYQIWPKYQCYTQKPEKTPPFYDNVMSGLQRWISFLHKAERILGTQSLEGHKCVGFEISPGMYGNFLVQVPVYIWFDVETKLPVRVERRGIETSYDPTMTLTIIHDQFNYYAEVPVDMFTLQIPEGFVNAELDEIIAARKGEMIFADVPVKLRDEIVAVLKEVETAVYQKRSEITVNGDLTVYPARKIYLSRDCWREDSYYRKSKLQTIEWYVIDKKKQNETTFGSSDSNFRLTRTIVDFEDNTYSVATYTKDDRHQHPMNLILFLASFINQADRILENTEIEGIECFVVEVSANKYGNNSPNDKHRMWFDMETKLPVRMEFEYWQSDGQTKSVNVRDQFQWDPELPDDTFTPKIPNGFTLVEVNEP